MLGEHGPVVPEEAGRVVVDVVNGHRQGRRRRLRRVAVVDGQDLNLKWIKVLKLLKWLGRRCMNNLK